MLRITDVAKNLLIINVLFFLAGFVVNTDSLALHFPGTPDFRPYQFATHFFMHAGFGHIFFNMFALAMFGSALEALWGPKRFLFYYFFCAVGAAILHLGVQYFQFAGLQQVITDFWATPSYDKFYEFFDARTLKMLTPEARQLTDQLGRLISDGANPEVNQRAAEFMQQVMDEKQGNTAMLGASGAIFGLLLAFGMLFPEQELMFIFLPVPIKAKYFIPVLMAVELFLGVNNFEWDNIAHFAHLGGALFGFLLILYWRKFNNDWMR